jgi:D-alanyl-D-alanine carboxypeptidase
VGGCGYPNTGLYIRDLGAKWGSIEIGGGQHPWASKIDQNRRIDGIDGTRLEDRRAQARIMSKVLHSINVGMSFLWIVASLSTASAQVNALQHLAATHLGSDQGVFVEAEDGTVLVAQQETRPVHPASVTKVATTLALLERLGPNHRFETRFASGRPHEGGSLDGDLVVESSGDPFFVFENAFLVLRELHARGLHEVSGNLTVQGPWMFNWQADPAGHRLKRTLEGLDGAEAWAAIGEPRSRLREVAVRFLAEAAQRPSGSVLVVHRSPPLLTIVKALNGYSNNVFHPLSDRIGGPKAVETIVREHLPADWQSEVTITNAAGAGETNRLSPRAAVAILVELRKLLRGQGKDLPSVLPVNGLDSGTLEKRLYDANYRARIVGKTGTFGSVGATALVGVLRTPKYGPVAFAVLNSWVPVAEARARQDAFLRALIDALEAQPWVDEADDRPIHAEARVD